MRGAASGSGQRTGVASTAARVKVARSGRGAAREPTVSTQATISTGWKTDSIFSATAPAATRAAVSRAEARPPPERARKPYFSA